MITLRPITPKDKGFLYRVYSSTREDELRQTAWSDEEKEAFLSMQFEAQHKYYMEQFPNAAFQLILSDDEPIGRLYLDRRADEFRLIDIALLPEHRNQGIGSVFMKKLLGEARAAGLPVRIHVERFNPALRLYQRLGFREISEDGVYLLMEAIPTGEQMPEKNHHATGCDNQEANDMLDKLRSQDFARYLNDTFSIQAESVGAIAAELIGVDELGARAVSEEDTGRRRPFAIVFRTAEEVLLPQRIYTIEHSEMGALNIFITPIGPDDKGMRYEAVFT